MEGIELRPRRAGEILDAALRLARRGFWRIAPTVVIGSVPPAVVAVLVMLSASGDEATSATEIGAIAVLALLLPFSVLLLSGASVVDLYHLALGVPLTRRRALRRTVGRVLPLFVHLVAVAILLGIAQTAVGMAALIPFALLIRIFSDTAVVVVVFTLLATFGIYLLQFAVMGRVALGVPAVVVDRDGPFKAIGRSLRLTAGKTWSTGVVLFAASLLSVALSLVVTLPVLIVVLVTLPDAAAGIGAVVGYVAVGLAAYTFFSALLVVLFIDGRVRAEGFDLELAAVDLGFERVPAGASSPWPGAPPWTGAGPPPMPPTLPPPMPPPPRSAA